MSIFLSVCLAICLCVRASKLCISPSSLQVTGTLGHQDTGIPGHWDTKISGQWDTGALGCRDMEILGHWDNGILDTGTPGQGIPRQWDTGIMWGVGVPTYLNCIVIFFNIRTKFIERQGSNCLKKMKT